MHHSVDKRKRADLADWLLMIGAWGVCFLMLLALLAYILFFMVPWALSGVIG